MPTLLIVEDDAGLQSQMRWCFEGIDVQVAADANEAQDVLKSTEPQVITLDLGLPPDPGGTSQGMALLRHIRSELPRTKVIVITGREEREHAIEAIAQGAYDYYQKPIDSQTLQFVVERAFRLFELEREIVQLQANQTTNERLPGLIAASERMLALSDQIERVAPTSATVVINGETGTGKEIVARSLHDLSPRSAGELITINCAAIPENLLESELFGHEKGSFTGAHARKIGKVEAANGGTLFLDEIGDMPLPLQAKILRFLQEREFERIGGTAPIAADVRVICATHRNLTEMTTNNDFREDLYYRLSEIVLEVPPLRDRETDVLLIADHVLRATDAERNLRFSADALEAMELWSWPGNVRELENKVRRAAIMCQDQLITAQDLELEQTPTTSIRPLRQVRAEAEQAEIRRALVASTYNISETARALEVSRPTLYSLMEKYAIAVEDSNS